MEKIAESDGIMKLMHKFRCVEESQGRRVAEYSISSVEEFIAVVLELYSIVSDGRKLFFRGQGGCDWTLKPSVFRSAINEKNITLDFKQHQKQMGVAYDCYKECDRMLGDMQHFGIPTRLLDWTTSPLLALSFACDATMEDGAVWAFNPWKWNGNAFGKLKAREHDVHVLARSLLAYGWNKNEAVGYAKRRFEFKGSIHNVCLPFACVNPFTTERKTAQRGCFMIFGEDSDLRDYRSFYKCAVKIRIPLGVKSSLKNELNLLDVNGFTQYPDPKGFACVIKEYGSLYSVKGLK